MGNGIVHIYQILDKVCLDIDDLFEFASDETNDKIIIKGRLYQSPQHGHWVQINNDNDRWKCSCCGYNFIGFNGLHQTFAEMCDYCPCCGAKMNEVEE